MQNTIHNINYLYCVTIFKLIITISIVNVHQLFYIATGIAMARPGRGPGRGPGQCRITADAAAGQCRLASSASQWQIMMASAIPTTLSDQGLNQSGKVSCRSSSVQIPFITGTGAAAYVDH